MFEKYIEDQKKRLHDGIALTAAPHNGFISAALLSKSRFIHDAYRRYFAAEIKRRTSEIRSELLKNPHFLITETCGAFIEQFEETLQNTAIFSGEELAQIIDDAVKARLNYLCRPRTAIKCFVFGENEELNAQEICMRLDYLHDYDYLIEGARQIIGDCGNATNKLLPETEFMQAVESIDNDYIFDLTPRQFVDILAPLFEFFSPDASPGIEKSIPTEALVIFLDDKHVEPIAQELERLYYDENYTEITESIFLKIVTDILDTIDEFEAENKSTNTVNSLPETDTEIMKTADVQIDSVAAKFIAAPGEFAAVLASKEFIAPEFIEIKKSKKFTVKFAPKTSEPPTADEDAQSSSVTTSLGELKESLAELGHTAKEAGETFDKVVETMEAMSEHLSGDKDDEYTSILNAEIRDCKESYYAPEEQSHDNEVTAEEEYFVCENNNYAESNAENTAGNTEKISAEYTERNISEELLYDGESVAKDAAYTFDTDVHIGDIVENDVENMPESANADDIVSLIPEYEKLLEEAGYVDVETPEYHAFEHDEIIDENSGSEEIEIPDIYQEKININTEQLVGGLDLSDAAQAANFPQISDILGDKRERFIKKLFEKDEAIFKQLSAEIDASPSWKTAAQIYDNFLIDHAISLDNSLAVEFRNVIKSRYAA